MSLPPFSYNALPPPGQDKPSYPKTNAHPESAPSSSNLKRNFFLRIGVFSILEASFIILAHAVGQNPVPLNLPPNITLTEAKGAFTVILILWHALAIFIAKDVLLHIFSAEWMEQYRMSGSLVPGETDVVSRMTSGFFDQLKHFKSSKVTLQFRLSFMGSVLLIFLNALGPSAISVSSIFLEYPLTIKIANLTMTKPLFSTTSKNGLLIGGGDLSNRLAIGRADTIVKIELLENTSYGFQSEENVLIPWPSLTLLSTNGTVKYESDVITYNFSCSWKQPMVEKTLLRWTINNNVWIISPEVDTPNFIRADTGWILPILEPRTNNQPDRDSIYPLNGFFFLGTNSTIHVWSPMLDLGDIPTNFIPSSNPDFIPSSISNFTLGNDTVPCLVSALICDPQMHLAPATVTLSNGHLQAATRSGPPIVKNIPVEAANVVFAESLMSMSFSGVDDVVISNIAHVVFLTKVTTDGDPRTASTKPLPLDQINQNMNRLLLSSAKAYLSGYQPEPDTDHPTSSSYETIDTNGTAEAQRLALTGSRPFGIALLVVVCILIVLLGFLVAGVRVDRLQTFDLENIFKTLKVD